jgi:flagellar biosynthesis/type III secretory pathway M-ring protein FliF/YscJ
MPPTSTHLVDYDTYVYLAENLEKCHETKMYYFSLVMNIVLVAIVVGGVSVFLYYRYRWRTSKKENQERMAKEQKYILSKIRQYQESSMAAHNKNASFLEMVDDQLDQRKHVETEEKLRQMMTRNTSSMSSMSSMSSTSNLADLPIIPSQYYL